MDKPKYLYHGSSECFNILQPYQTHDALSQAASQNAVFATPIRDAAIAFALGAVPDEHGRVTRVICSMEPVEMLFLEGRPNLGGKGYLYTVLADEFEPLDAVQWICRHPVKPLEVVEINVDDYVHLFRYATEEEKRALERLLKAGPQ